MTITSLPYPTTPAPLTLAGANRGTYVTFEVAPTEICDPVTDALIRYVDNGGPFGGVVTGLDMVRYGGAPCFVCKSHWHVAVTDARGWGHSMCAQDLTPVDSAQVLAGDDTHGRAEHTGTPDTCWGCRRDAEDAAYAAAGDPWGPPHLGSDNSHGQAGHTGTPSTCESCHAELFGWEPQLAPPF